MILVWVSFSDQEVREPGARAGLVAVEGETELRLRRKIRPGMRVDDTGQTLTIL